MTHIPAPRPDNETHLESNLPVPEVPTSAPPPPANPLTGAVRALMNGKKIKGVKDLIDFEWRTGGKKSRQAKFIYAQLGDSPSKDDPLIGEMYSPLIAEAVVADHNGWLD